MKDYKAKTINERQEIDKTLQKERELYEKMVEEAKEMDKPVPVSEDMLIFDEIQNFNGIVPMTHWLVIYELQCNAELQNKKHIKLY